MSTNRWLARLRGRTASHAGTGVLNAKVTAPVTLLAVTLGYVLDGSATAAITGLSTFLSLVVVSVANAVVQYLRAGTLQETSGPPAVIGGAETFWGALTPHERHALIARARGRLYRREDVLCHEGGTAGEVIVILSGWTRVWVQEGPDQRIVAFHGPGELVRERADAGSATVTAESDVQALRIGAGDFGAFLEERPRVRAVLEQQADRRQIERRDPPEMSQRAQGSPSILITAFQASGSRPSSGRRPGTRGACRSTP